MKISRLLVHTLVGSEAALADHVGSCLPYSVGQSQLGPPRSVSALTGLELERSLTSDYSEQKAT